MTGEEYQRLIWVLLGRLGGRAQVSWTELEQVPRFPALTVQTAETGFVVSWPVPATTDAK